MNQVDTITKYVPLKGYVTTYFFKYTFSGLKYLVCDKFGNFYILPHCKGKRTSYFKKLDSSKKYIYYQGIKHYLTRLKIKVIIKKTKYKEYEKKND